MMVTCLLVAGAVGALAPLPGVQEPFRMEEGGKILLQKREGGVVANGFKRIRTTKQVANPTGSVNVEILPDLLHGRPAGLENAFQRFASVEFRVAKPDPAVTGSVADVVKVLVAPTAEPGVATVDYEIDMAAAARMTKAGATPRVECRWSTPLGTPPLVLGAGRSTVTTYAGDDRRELVLTLPPSAAKDLSVQKIVPKGRKGCEHAVWSVTATSGETKGRLRIDLGKGRRLVRAIRPSYGPVDFDFEDALHVPVRPTRNLIPNGGFEQGLKGWKMHSPCQVDLTGYAKAVENGGTCYEEITDGAKFGRRCCRFRRTVPGTRNDAVTSPAISLYTDRDYVLSYWIKADGPGETSLAVSPSCPVQAKGGRKNRLHPSGGTKGLRRTFSAKDLSTTEWRRFETAFRSDAGVVEVLLSGQGVLVDGVMLEEGTKASETVDDPYVAHLVTASPENDLAFGQPFDARLEVTCSAPSDGKVRVRVSNYYSETVFDGSFALTPETKTIPLALDPARIGQGVFIVRYDFETASASWSDYERFSVTDFLDNDHPTAFFFLQYPYFQTHGSAGVRMAKWMRTRGIGSTSWPRNDDRRTSPLKDLYDTGRFRSGVHTLEHDLKFRYPDRFAWGTPGLKSFCSNVTDEVVAFIEKEAYLSGSVCEPADNLWAFSNEEEAGFSLLREKADFASFARLQNACAKGLRKAFDERGLKLWYAPTHGMCNFNTTGMGGVSLDKVGTPADRRWSFERMLDASRAIGHKYDFISMHMYGAVDGTALLNSIQDRGENAEALFALLRRYGYDDVPVRFEEGFNILPFKVAAWGAGGWADQFYSTPPSQACGHTEFLHAAVIARQYLMDLKYWPRVQTSHVWQHRPVADFAFTPWMWTKVSNTIGHLLPDPRCIADSKPAPRVRAYVYRQKDAQGEHGVLAIWSTDPLLERGAAPARQFALDLPSEAQFVDLMGNRRARPADGQVTLTPAPLFVITPNVYDLCRAIGR